MKINKSVISNYLIAFSLIMIIISLSAKALFLFYGTLPTFNKIQSVRILRIEGDLAFISLVIDVENKNIIPFIIKDSNVYAYDSKQKIGDVFIDNDVTVSANTSTILRLQMSIPREKVETLLLNGSDQYALELQGTCRMNMLGLTKKVKIDEKIEVPVVKMMEEYVFRSFQYAIFSEPGDILISANPMQLRIPLKFRNESGFDVYIADLKSNVYLNQTLAGQGNISESFQLPNKVKDYSTRLVFNLNDWQSLGYSSSNFLKERVVYRIEGKLTVSLWNKPYAVNIDLHGEVPVKK